jgi:hypothetical protein
VKIFRTKKKYLAATALPEERIPLSIARKDRKRGRHGKNRKKKLF